MNNRIYKTILVLCLAGLTLGSPRPVHADLFSGLRDQINVFVSGKDWAAIAAKAVQVYIMRAVFRENLKNRGCGCAAKNDQADPIGNYAQPGDIPVDPSIFFWGDSRIHFLEPLFKDYMPNYRSQVKNLALGGTTSGDFRWYYDLCGGGEYSKFYPNTNESNHLQLENKISVILTGGNDFEQFEAGLRALPWLIPLRHGAVLNNMNRLVSYHQAQDAQVMMVSQMPIPAYDGSVSAPWLAHFLQGVLLNLSSIAPDQTHMNFVLDRRHFTTAELTRLEGFSTTSIAKLYARLTGQDFGRPWLSMQMGHLTVLTVPFVVSKRKTAFANLWFNFKDPGARYEAWWSGNVDLFRDAVHFNEKGGVVFGNLMEQHFNQFGFNNNPMLNPDGSRKADRCNYVPGTTFAEGQPGRWTPEPDPLPEANDDALLLLLLCFGLGACG